MNALIPDKKLDRIRAKHIKQCGLLEYTFDDYRDVEYLLQLINFKSGQLAQRDELLDESKDFVRWIIAQIESMRCTLQERNK